MKKPLLAHLILLLALMCSFAGCTHQHALDFTQVAVGDDGPPEPGVAYFENADAAAASWLAKSLSPQQFRAAIAQTDFRRQMLVAVSAGPSESFSGQIRLVNVNQYTGASNLPINFLAQVGFKAGGCHRRRVAYPFVLAVVDKPQVVSGDMGLDLTNVERACEPAEVR